MDLLFRVLSDPRIVRETEDAGYFLAGKLRIDLLQRLLVCRTAVIDLCQDLVDAGAVVHAFQRVKVEIAGMLLKVGRGCFLLFLQDVILMRQLDRLRFCARDVAELRIEFILHGTDQLRIESTVRDDGRETQSYGGEPVQILLGFFRIEGVEDHDLFLCPGQGNV